MPFRGPEPADLANVRALNQTFIDLVRSGRARCGGQGDGIAALDRRRSERLAGCPFLLYSLSEHDEERWERGFETVAQQDLVDVLARPGDELVRLGLVTLGFLWQFAQRRPYAARVVSGAPLAWCEMLGESTLVGASQFVANEPGLIGLRLAEDAGFWRKLLVAGTSHEQEVRDAAQLSALATLLTRTADDIQLRLPVAARSMPSTQSAVLKSGQRGYNTRPDESPVHKIADEDLRQR